MPPKAQKKKQQKIIEDRTFGLKNKNKSKAVQKFVKGVQSTVKNAGKSTQQLQAEQFQRKKLKKKQQQQEALMNSLFNNAKNLRNNGQDDQEDPANTVCPYFKQGLCQRGKKCIYSHDLTLDRTQQIDLYVDQRTQLIMNELGDNQLNVLTQQELHKIINQKEKNTQKGGKTDIICKFFLDSVEKGKYGWNWNCINGDKCQYKHCLPAGYKLKKDIIKVAQQVQDIQDKIDEQRNKLLSNNTSPMVTYEIFLKWKAEKQLKKLDDAEKKKKQEQKKKGKNILRTGKQLFNYDPTLFIDDQEAAVDGQYEIQQIPQGQEEENDEQKRQQMFGEDDEEREGDEYQENNENEQQNIEKVEEKEQQQVENINA